MLGRFYGDLTDERYTTNFAIYHRRFSTNTVPKWPLAQPMRCLAHNGEINTLIGNVNWQRALDVQRGRRDPLCSDTKSDSANLDSVFENAIRGTGKQPVLALSALVPEAYRDQPAYDDHPEVTAMLDYYAGLQEPWDGPALLTFCDGTQLGAQLDRNGLRPARFLETKDGLVAFMSETGVVEVDDADVVRKGRLGPGNCITINLETGEFKTNLEVKKGLAAEAPYSEWMAAKAKKVPYRDEFAVECEAEVPPGLVQQMTAFGWTSEDLEMQARCGEMWARCGEMRRGVGRSGKLAARACCSGEITSPTPYRTPHLPISPPTPPQVADMSNGGKETLFSLGDDTPLAVLSSQPRSLYDYFKQRFAQVTNPPIDPLREGVVMGLEMTVGKRHDLALAPSEELADVLTVATPVLNAAQLGEIRAAKPTATVSTLYPIAAGPDGLRRAVEELCAQAGRE